MENIDAKMQNLTKKMQNLTKKAKFDKNAKI